jgi:hypothetical protein
MTLEGCLTTVENFELALYKQLSLLNLHTRKEAQTARNLRYLCLYVVGILSVISSMVRAFIQSSKWRLLLGIRPSKSGTITDSSGEGTRGAREIDMHTQSPSLEAVIESVKEDSGPISFLIQEGETHICTLSGGPTQGAKSIFIPQTQASPPLSIRIRMAGGQVNESKLIFHTSRKNGVKLLRRFGTDEIPVRINENFNLSTDRILVGDDVSVRFSTNLRRVSSGCT